MVEADAGKNKNYIIWILGALATVSPFSIDMYLPSFSQIADDYGTTPAKISLSVSSYFIGLAIGQMLYGPLLDRFGRKRPLYAGLIIFVAASVGCMQSATLEALIVFRFTQALGGCVAWVGAMAMVRDFFPVRESAKIFSLLVLILGVSPLLAPTFGSFIAVSFGWQAIFIVLAVIVILILLIVFFFLPEGQQPDRSVSLKAGPMVRTFYSILREPQFSTYAFSGAFSFATLFIYVAGSPVIFIEMYHVSPQAYGGLFALLSVGFIGSSQVNIFLVRRFTSEQLFRVGLVSQVFAGLVFFCGVYFEVFGLYGTLTMFFICLCCMGIINPNASALALAPFTRNVGSASALLGCTQIGVAALASGCVGLFDSSDTVPIIALLSATSIVAWVILGIGRRKITAPVAATEDAGQVVH
jgi:MFS transporter, DHA1 family, multidrug resistance protein